ncbi:MAG: hypothetical protein ACI32C_02650 [Candidatus Enteromonas sp.]
MKKRLYLSFGLCISGICLASAGYENRWTINDFTRIQNVWVSAIGSNPDNAGKPYEVGKEYSFDAGRSSIGISQRMHFKIEEVKEYDSSYNAYPLLYDPIFISPAAITSYTLTLERSWTKNCSFAYSTSQSRSVSNQFAGALNIPGFGKVTTGSEVSTEIMQTETFTYSFGEAETIRREYTFNLSRIPAGYICTPVLMVSAKFLRYKYSLKDCWWWGEQDVSTSELVNQSKSMLIYDKGTAFMTLGIKKVGTSGAPTHYIV